MATKILNFRASEETAKRVEAEATRVPYRTVSTWLREVVEAALPKPARKAKTK